MRDKHPSERQFRQSKIDKTIQELAELVARYSLQDTIQIGQDRIVISNKPESIWGTILYLFILVLVPAGGIVYLLYGDYPPLIAGLVALFIAANLFSFYKIAVGENRVEINLLSKNVRIESITSLFSSFFQPHSVPFAGIKKAFSKKKTTYSNYSKTIWLRLLLSTESGEEIKAVDLRDPLPFRQIGVLLVRLLEQLRAAEKGVWIE